jgi:hypothetical protein
MKNHRTRQRQKITAQELRNGKQRALVWKVETGLILQISKRRANQREEQVVQRP